jgi:dCMP deaminase
MSDERKQLKHGPDAQSPAGGQSSELLRHPHVAVLLRRDGSVAGVGYNGALPGQPHCEPETCNPSVRCFNTRHAERSALDYSTGEVAAAYVTHEPCLRCTQDLIARGCRAVYYLRSYDIADAAEARARQYHRETNGVSWVKLE